MMSGGVRDVEIPVCNVDLSTRTSCVHDLVTFWASHADLDGCRGVHTDVGRARER